MPEDHPNSDNFVIQMNARHLWHPFAHPGEMRDAPPMVVDRAEGVRITDDRGHTTIDAVGGLWCANLGYSCQPIKDAIADQLARLPYYNAFKGATNAPAIRLTAELARLFAPDGMGRAFLTAGGSDAVDSALKLARQYHKLRGQPERTKFVALTRAYHGTHWGGTSVNGNPAYRAPYEPLLPGCVHVPSPYAYRNPFGEDDPDQLRHLCLAALEEAITFQSPGTVAAVILEPVQGAGGVIVPPPGYVAGVREICDRHGVLMICDEVITGFGRTGAFSGSRLWGVQPDMMTLAKAITSAYFPMGAVMLSDTVAEAFEGDGGAMVPHGYTYSGHPVGCAAALACLAETERLRVWETAGRLGPRLMAGLERLRRHDAVGDVRGIGLMAAVEVVSDRAARTPDPAHAGRVFDATHRAGVTVRWSGANLVCSPPLIVTADEVDAIVDTLDRGFAEAAKG